MTGSTESTGRQIGSTSLTLVVVVGVLLAAVAPTAIASQQTAATADPLRVTTESATNVTESSATLNGNVTALGGAANATVWFEYWVKGNRSGTLALTTPRILEDPGQFSANISGLDSNTTYVYVAHAEANDTSVSGEQVEFTTDVAAVVDVQTRGFETITDTSATLLGQVETLEDAENATVWFEYWVQGNTSTRTKSETLTLESPGDFEITVTDLRSNTTYEFRAHAEAQGTTDRGDILAFTTIETRSPAVDTHAATNVTNTSATLNGNVTDLGGAENATVWFEYWIKGNRTGTVAFTPPQLLNDPSPFSSNVTNLQNETTYVYVAHAEASDGDTVVGDRIEFATGDVEPLAVVTEPASDVTNDSATLHGELRNLGGAANATVWFEYWVVGNKSETVAFTTPQQLDDPNDFSAIITGLQDNTTYAYVAHASASDGEADAGVLTTFTTQETPPLDDDDDDEEDEEEQEEQENDRDDDHGPGDEAGPGDERGPGDESGSGDEYGPGDESGNGTERGPGNEADQGDEYGPGDEFGPGDEYGPGEEHGPGHGHGPEQKRESHDHHGDGSHDNEDNDDSKGRGHGHGNNGVGKAKDHDKD